MRSKYKYKYKYNYTYKYFRIVVNMGSKYKAGVPELDLPALDPLIVWTNIDTCIFLMDLLTLYETRR